MDTKKFGKKARKVLSASNINLKIEYLDPQYTLEVSSPAAATAHGLLVIFRLVPNTANLPSFEGRWHDKQNTIKVDLIDTKGTRRKKGFQGHHPERISEDPRVDKIDIRLPEFKVHKALHTLNVRWGLSFEASMQQIDGCFSREVLPKKKESMAHRVGTRLFKRLGGLK